MKVLKIAGAVLVLLLIATSLLSNFALSAFIRKAGKDKLVAGLSQGLGVPVTVGGITSERGGVLGFLSKLSFRDVKVANPPGFRGQQLFHAKELNFRIRTIRLLLGRVKAESIEVIEPSFVLERNAEGLTNLGKFLMGIGRGNKAAQTDEDGFVEDVSIARASIINGAAFFEDVKITGINLTLRNLSRGSVCKASLSAKLFGGPKSSLTFEGEAGPFPGGVVPMKGKLSVTLAPAEAPALVEKYYGHLISRRNPEAALTLTMEASGDLTKELSGPASVTLNEFAMGRDRDHRLPLAGRVTGTYRIVKPIAPLLTVLDIRDGQVSLGSGTWKGSLRIEHGSGSIQGESKGAITAADVHEYLSSFTQIDAKLSGRFDIASYDLSFAGKDASGLSVAVKSAKVANGNLQWEDLKVTDVGITVANLAPNQISDVTLTGKLFGGPNSRLQYAGRAGPFAGRSIPLDGKLTMTVLPAEAPPALAAKLYTGLFASQGPKAAVTFEVSATGDLDKEIGGPTTLTLTDFAMGRDARHLLPLSGNAAGTYRVKNPMAEAATWLDIPAGKLRLGSGTWQGSMRVQRTGGQVRGDSKGSITGVDVNQFLSCLTTAEGKLYGTMSIPAYSVSFSGRTSDEILLNQKGQGSVVVHKGWFQQLNVLGILKRALDNPLALVQSEKPASASGARSEFGEMSTRFNIANRQLRLSELLVESAGARVRGAGVIGYDQSLNFQLKADAYGRVAVPVGITGTVSNPVVKPDVKGAALGTAKNLFSFKKKPKK